MNIAYLLIGGNVGNRLQNLRTALHEIDSRCGKIIVASAIYETEAWGITAQDPFLNQALKIHTLLDARELLNNILKIEEKLGRKRERKYGPRIIDVDILLFNHEIISEPGLKVPHPELQNRRFALHCLNDIATNEVHPVYNKTIYELLQLCPDPLQVKEVNSE
ncbi:MAG: 2-amino-4-hydroxy-6-hydroxymethyldihydropteridine diphosphokinase [Chitinophagaceae bacterium]|nr:2-amino-4-hydroxy-6-hydroxymethyldihydropteridine diphosphokinase [Chitinophagaceae bacterium]